MPDTLHRSHTIPSSEPDRSSALDGLASTIAEVPRHAYAELWVSHDDFPALCALISGSVGWLMLIRYDGLRRGCRLQLTQTHLRRRSRCPCRLPPRQWRARPIPVVLDLTYRPGIARAPDLCRNPYRSRVHCLIQRLWRLIHRAPRHTLRYRGVAPTDLDQRLPSSIISSGLILLQQTGAVVSGTCSPPPSTPARPVPGGRNCKRAGPGPRRFRGDWHGGRAASLATRPRRLRRDPHRGDLQPRRSALAESGEQLLGNG